jgi:hypothetical protein
MSIDDITHQIRRTVIEVNRVLGHRFIENEWFLICPKGNANNIRPSRPDMVCVSRTSEAEWAANLIKWI